MPRSPYRTGVPRTRSLTLVAAALGLLATLSVHAESSGRRGDATPFCGDEGVWLQISAAAAPRWTTPDACQLHGISRQPGATSGRSSLRRVLALRPGGWPRERSRRHRALHRPRRADDGPAGIPDRRPRGGTQPAAADPRPDGGAGQPDTVTAVDRLIGPQGAYPELAGFLPPQAVGRFRASPRNVPATGQRRWADFGNDQLQLSAVPPTSAVCRR